ncbi:MAG: hypothetical protein JXR71_09935 [Bacteroidales bacterium]|nr:hypothetical protein [Bacteroidales bacterium]
MGIRRLFRIQDAVLLEHADVIAAQLHEDLSAFSAFDRTINEEFINRIQQMLEAIKSFPSDGELEGKLSEQTQRVNTALSGCYDDYKKLAHFTRKMLSSNPSIRNKFGMNEITKARQNQTKMLILMNKLVKNTNRYSVELSRLGCPKELIGGLPGKAEALLEASMAQKNSKNERRINAERRVQLLNNLFLLMKDLNNIARHIYRNDKAQMQKYLLPRLVKKQVNLKTDSHKMW